MTEGVVKLFKTKNCYKTTLFTSSIKLYNHNFFTQANGIMMKTDETQADLCF